MTGVSTPCPPDPTSGLVEEVAAPVPIAVIADMFGVAVSDRHQFRRWSDAVIESTDRTEEEQADELGQMAAFLMEHIDSPRTDTNDLLNLLKTSRSGTGRSPGRDHGLLPDPAGGRATRPTRTLISGGSRRWPAIPTSGPPRGRPRPMPGAVEEMLRWVTPIQAFGRTAAVDVEIAGTPVAAGEFVVLLYASANRDERSSVPPPTGSRSTAPTCPPTWPSDSASTSASGPAWPGWRPGSSKSS